MDFFNYQFPDDLLNLVPVLDDTIPACCGHLAGFVRVPKRRNANIVMGLPLLQ